MKRLRQTVGEVLENYTGSVSISNEFLAPADFHSNSADRHGEALKGLELTIN